MDVVNTPVNQSLHEKSGTPPLFHPFDKTLPKSSVLSIKKRLLKWTLSGFFNW
jgi:hypothetical protein